MQEKGGGGEQEKIADRKVLLIIFSYESRFTGALSGGTGASIFFLPGSVNFLTATGFRVNYRLRQVNNVDDTKTVVNISTKKNECINRTC